ncbi:MAG: hypothetical protein GX811_01675 [Lentisphaerae bacterium]|nr:hypothetical protein [Lentisphaerota bacterium]
MGDCIYCGKPAGLLKKSHRECVRKYEQGKSKIVSMIARTGSKGGDLDALKSSIDNIAKTSLIDPAKLKSLIVAGWEQAVELAFEDNILSKEEESALINLKRHFSLTQNMVDQKGAFTKTVKGAVLRDLFEGILPERVDFSGNILFNLQKSEQLIWVFQNVAYYEEKTRSRIVGGSHGFSVRVVKGLYYRTGAFRGERVQSSETIHADSGVMGITNKHIYFAGPSKRFRIAFDKIVAFDSFSDGIGIQRDAQSAKPQTFVTGDGWFTYNLITNLAQK